MTASYRVACLILTAAPGNDAWTFASATVTGDTVHARTTDGREWRAGYDPGTLRPTTPVVDRCSGAPRSSS